MTDETPQQSEVERVARAIAGVGYGEREFHPWDCLKEQEPEDAELVREQARAAIAALATLRPKVSEAEVREVLDEAHEVMHQCTAVLTYRDCAEVACAMAEIRALLARLNQADNREGEK